MKLGWVTRGSARMALTELLVAFALAHAGVAARDSLPPNLVHDAKSIVIWLSTGHADSVQARMTPAAQQRYTAAQRDSLWHVLVSQVGAFKKFGAARVEPDQDGGHKVVLELDFAQGPLRGTVAYDSTGRVALVVFQSQ